MFIWFNGKHDFLQYVTQIKSYQLEAERYLSSQSEVSGYCVACRGVRKFTVNAGVYFGPLPNLREGLVLVVEAEETRSAVAKKVRDQILMQEGNLLGMVFTKRRLYIPESLYKLF